MIIGSSLPERKPTGDLYPIGILGILLFVPLFVYRQLWILDFWWWMSLNLIILVSLSFVRDNSLRREQAADLQSRVWKKVLWGLASAVLLYLVFFVGNIIVRESLDFAGQDIRQVYGFKGQAGSWRIGLLMLFFIGPGEELFWRGFIQGNLSGLFGKIPGFWYGVFFYTLIHVVTGNLVLILAALTGGLFWGWLYMRYRSLLLNVVSHIVWDIAVFLFFPLGGA